MSCCILWNRDNAQGPSSFQRGFDQRNGACKNGAQILARAEDDWCFVNKTASK